VSDKHSLKCTSCAAPLEYFSGERIITCRYCGTTIVLEDGVAGVTTVDCHRVVTNHVRQDTLHKSLQIFLSARRLAPGNLLEDLEWGNILGRYLPYWVLDCHSTTCWTGSSVQVYSEHDKDDRTHTKTRYVPRDGSFDENLHWPVYGRRADEHWGQDALVPGGLRLRPDWGSYPLGWFGFERAPASDLAEGGIAFEPKTLCTELHLIHGQLDEREALESAKEELRLRGWKKAKRRVSVLQHCQTTVRCTDSSFVHVPFWWLEYSYDSKSYRALFHGGTGDLLCAEYPVADGYKLLISALCACLVTGLLLMAAPASWWRMGILVALWAVVLAQALGTIWTNEH